MAFIMFQIPHTPLIQMNTSDMFPKVGKFLAWHHPIVIWVIGHIDANSTIPKKLSFFTAGLFTPPSPIALSANIYSFAKLHKYWRKVYFLYPKCGGLWSLQSGSSACKELRCRERLLALFTLTSLSQHVPHPSSGPCSCTGIGLLV